MAKPRYSRVPARKSSSLGMFLTMLTMFTVLILILLALGILSIPSSNSGNSPKPNDLSSIVHNFVDSEEDDEGRVEHWVEVISWEPRAFIYHNFLSKEECEYLIDLAKPYMEKSTVVDGETGKSKIAGYAQVLERFWLEDGIRVSGILRKGLQILPSYQ